MREFTVKEGPVELRFPASAGMVQALRSLHLTIRFVAYNQRYTAVQTDMDAWTVLTPFNGVWKGCASTLNPNEGDPLTPGNYYVELILGEGTANEQEIDRFTLHVINVVSY